MYRVKSVWQTAVGLGLMAVISILFGFVQTEIPNVGYLVMWILCGGMICHGVGVRVVF